MKQQVFFFSSSQIETTAIDLLDALGEQKIVFFKGIVGAGKTTLIKAICRQLGVEEGLSSPTFSLVNEYADENKNIVAYHMDLYRLKSIEEAAAIGLSEYLESGKYCFIEWPELLENEVEAAVVTLEITDFGNRRLSLSVC